jgi:hypothetical protein
MPNVTWQEPQVIVDLLAMNLFAHENRMLLPASREIAIISPWLSDVEIFLRPGPWYQQLTVGDSPGAPTLQSCLTAFCHRGWDVHVAVLAYGTNPCGIIKEPERFETERRLLGRLIQIGAAVHLVPDLHAKGIVTPLAIVTGSTNLTTSGLFAQAQNANYFSFSHADFFANRVQLLARYQHIPPTQVVP